MFVKREQNAVLWDYMSKGDLLLCASLVTSSLLPMMADDKIIYRADFYITHSMQGTQTEQ